MIAPFSELRNQVGRINVANLGGTAGKIPSLSLRGGIFYFAENMHLLAVRPPT